MWSTEGSSPLARGLRQLGGLDVDGPRIIPARAGFTRVITFILVSPRDHPRSRGVYALAWDEAAWAAGSSPLARGLLFSSSSSLLSFRIIPARAGFTDNSHDLDTQLTGSSPLARGLPPQGPLGLGADGIIPARAGFTQNSAHGSTRATDHPRSRGVYHHRQPAGGR